jgi:hypothetical protein
VFYYKSLTEEKFRLDLSLVSRQSFLDTLLERAKAFAM